MIKKYNLALVPLSQSNETIALAEKLSSIADKYLLSEKSLPHITLYQFQAEEKKIDDIWKQVCNMWEEKPIDLVFNEFSCITFDNSVFWASLLPNNCDALYKMHSAIANILRLPIKKSFDPHMTLISTRNSDYKKEVAKLSDLYKPMVDKFVLSLGVSDDIGQLTEIIYHYDIKKELACKL